MKKMNRLAIVFLALPILFACEEETVDRQPSIAILPSAQQKSVTMMADSDGDGVADTEDNCPYMHNPRQEDYNDNGIGDICEDQIYETEMHGGFTSLSLGSRPRPCPKPVQDFRGGNDPVEHCSPKIDVFIPEFRFEIAYIRGEIISEAGETYACTTEDCDGSTLTGTATGTVWMSFGVVNPELSEAPLLMIVTLGYYRDGELIYDELLGEVDPRMLEEL